MSVEMMEVKDKSIFKKEERAQENEKVHREKP